MRTPRDTNTTGDKVRVATRGIRRVAYGLVFGLLAAGCIARDPATDLGDPDPPAPTAPTTPTAPPTTPTTPEQPIAPGVAYVQDMVPIFDADCVRCHSGSRPDGNYSMTSYEAVMRKVQAGNSRSGLVTSTQNRGSMYRYWSGNAAAKAALVRSWVVDYAAQRTR